MRKSVWLLFLPVVLFCSVGTVSAATVYLGDPATGGDLQLSVVADVIYDFEVYIELSEAEGGLFGAGIDINYNSSIFRLSGTPAIDMANFSDDWSEVKLPGTDGHDYVTGDDFAFYAVDFDHSHSSGVVHVGSFSLLALFDSTDGAELIWTGEYSGADDIVAVNENGEGRCIDGDTVFYGVQSVPIPSTFLLLGGGVVTLIGIGRRRARK